MATHKIAIPRASSDATVEISRGGGSGGICIYMAELPLLIDEANNLLRRVGMQGKTATRTGTGKSFFSGGPEV